MRTINFKYDIDDMVKTALGSLGIVSMLGVDDSGPVYFVKTDQNSDWFKEDQLSGDNLR